MARKKVRSQLGAIDEINMTPLIDLTFLLLIIFMITAPLLEYGVDVSPPEMNAEKLPDTNSRVINLNRHGQIVFDQVPVSEERLLESLRRLREVAPQTVLLLRADGSRPYRDVMGLMKAIKDSGFINISLVTTAESNE